MPDYRMQLANERTFLAWQGMSLSLLAASIAVQSVPAPGNSELWSALGIILALLATGTAVTGLVRWRHIDRERRGDAEIP
jgi:putative membrane protein